MANREITILAVEFALTAYDGLTKAEAQATLMAESVSVVTDTVDALALWASANGGEYIALDAASRNTWDQLIARSEPMPADMRTLQLVRAAFGASSQTEIAVLALRTKQISRAEELGISRVRQAHVNEAWVIARG